MYAHHFLRRVHGRDYTITIANKYVSSSVQEKAYFASAYAKTCPNMIPLTYVEKAYKKAPSVPCGREGGAMGQSTVELLLCPYPYFLTLP